jgi:hypothetical protein
MLKIPALERYFVKASKNFATDDFSTKAAKHYENH